MKLVQDVSDATEAASRPANSVVVNRLLFLETEKSRLGRPLSKKPLLLPRPTHASQIAAANVAAPKTSSMPGLPSSATTSTAPLARTTTGALPPPEGLPLFTASIPSSTTISENLTTTSMVQSLPSITTSVISMSSSSTISSTIVSHADISSVSAVVTTTLFTEAPAIPLTALTTKSSPPTSIDAQAPASTSFLNTEVQSLPVPMTMSPAPTNAALQAQATIETITLQPIVPTKFTPLAQAGFAAAALSGVIILMTAICLCLHRRRRRRSSRRGSSSSSVCPIMHSASGSGINSVAVGSEDEKFSAGPTARADQMPDARDQINPLTMEQRLSTAASPECQLGETSPQAGPEEHESLNSQCMLPSTSLHRDTRIIRDSGYFSCFISPEKRATILPILPSRPRPSASASELAASGTTSHPTTLSGPNPITLDAKVSNTSSATPTHKTPTIPANKPCLSVARDAKTEEIRQLLHEIDLLSERQAASTAIGKFSRSKVPKALVSKVDSANVASDNVKAGFHAGEAESLNHAGCDFEGAMTMASRWSSCPSSPAETPSGPPSPVMPLAPSSTTSSTTSSTASSTTPITISTIAPQASRYKLNTHISISTSQDEIEAAVMRVLYG